MSKLLLAAFLTCLTILPLQAVQMHVLAWDQNIAKRKLAIAYGNKSVRIRDMHHFTRSKAVKISEQSANLRIIAEDRLSEEGTPLFLPIEIPANIKKPLLLVLPDKTDPIGVKTLCIEDSVENFKWGSIRFVNVTGEDLIFRHEKQNRLIPSGWKPTSVTPKGKNRNMGVSIYLRKNLKIPPLYSSIWRHRQDLRKLVIIVPSKDKSRGLIDFRFIVENRIAIQAERKTTQAELQQ